MNVPEGYVWDLISRRMKEAERIRKENDEKDKEFQRESQKLKEEMEAFRKKNFPDD